MMKLTLSTLMATAAQAQISVIGGGGIHHGGVMIPGGGILPQHPTDPLPDPEPTPPRDCTIWNDGCNTCRRTSADMRSGAVGGCTMMMCFRAAAPFCAAFTDGRTCTSCAAPAPRNPPSTYYDRYSKHTHARAVTHTSAQ